jgi:hypothetical protein
VDALRQVSLLGVIKIASPFVAWAGFQIRQRYKKRVAIGWQPTQGTVHSARAEYADSIWTLVVSYSYSWEGEYYSGFHMKQFASEKAAEAAGERFPNGSSLMVRVNVDDPQTSAILDEEQFLKS